MKKRGEDERPHRWDVTPAEAREIQEKLREKWEGRDRLGGIRTVAGLDAAFVLNESQALKKKVGRWQRLREANQAIGCAVVYRVLRDMRKVRTDSEEPTLCAGGALHASGQADRMGHLQALVLEEVERAYAVVPLEFPYIPGLLSFREIPALLAALGKLHEMPDLLFCDGQGYAHPRRFGLAAHLGVWLNRPTIGCAKSILIGEHGELATKAGSWVPLIDPANGERIGAAVRTRVGVKPVYVSQGNRVSLATAIRLTLAVSDGVWIPRPTREADRFASEVKKKLVAG